MSWKIEVINPDYKKGRCKYIIFDFDGTISLIREGWQKVMKTYFYEELRKTPLGKTEDESSLRACIDNFIDINTGKQTIYQCFELIEEIRNRQGKPLEAIEYKDEYQDRLLKKVQHRIEGLTNKTLDPLDYVVPGSFEFLKALKEHNVKLLLVSGTDEYYAKNEADILGVSDFFDGDVFGAQRDYKSFSKKMVVDRIIRENNLYGNELVGIGDGFVEIKNIKGAGGFTIGVASDEKNHNGEVNEWKRERLIKAGADVIIPDFSYTNIIINYIMESE